MAIDAPLLQPSQITEFRSSAIPKTPKNQGIGFTSPPKLSTQPFIPSFGPIEPQFIGYPLDFAPVILKKFSDISHRPTLSLNKKRRASTSPQKPLIESNTPRTPSTKPLSYKELILKARDLVT